MTQVCVPIIVTTEAQTLRDAALAAEHGADLIELRVDEYAAEADPGTDQCARFLRHMIESIELPVILTCRSHEEGGAYDGEDSDRVSLLESVCLEGEHPPAYLDFELAAYRRSANIRQKIDLCVEHPNQVRTARTRLILSMHDFDGRPPDLTRRLLDAYSEPAAAVVKFAYRARSLRDNLDIFDILRDAPKPTIGLGMGEFGLMSRVLATKFGGYLTFASLIGTAGTAPGQPTIQDLLGTYRFRSIGRDTKVYGVIGWPVSQSMGPLVHNAGFGAVGHDAVYLPLPIAADAPDPEASRLSLITTLSELWGHDLLDLNGLSVTLPFKADVLGLASEPAGDAGQSIRNLPHASGLHPALTPTRIGAANTLVRTAPGPLSPETCAMANTDAAAIMELLKPVLADDKHAGWASTESGSEESEVQRVAVIGAGGVARAAVMAAASLGAAVTVFNRSEERARSLADAVNALGLPGMSTVTALPIDSLSTRAHAVYINCTPVGMAAGPDPQGFSIPRGVIENAATGTVFFDTVYNPIGTPMLQAARDRGCRIIDGVQMFVRQAEMQFEHWTGRDAPGELFDGLVRAELSRPAEASRA